MKTDYFSRPVLPVLIKPGAARSEILGEREGRLHIALKAPAYEGKANAELLRYLRAVAGKRYEIVGGATSRKKLLRIV